MRRLSHIILFSLIVLALQTRPALADGTVDQSVRKLGRGLANVLTGWFELPTQISSGMSEAGGIQGLFLGLGKGAVWTLFREGAGVYDTVTFLFPLPADYEPLMQPPTVFDY